MRLLRAAGPVVLLGALIIQLVPYGATANPAARSEPAWNAPRTRELAVRACFDCHSNETAWPWYSRVAPLSWLVRRDVDKGRAKLNLSEWGLRRQEAGEAAETVAEGEMPMAVYSLLHAEARLTAAERRELVAGLTATLGGKAGERRGERRD